MNTELAVLEETLMHWRDLYALLAECNNKINKCRASSHKITIKGVYSSLSAIPYEKDLAYLKEAMERVDEINSYLQQVVQELQVFEVQPSTII